MQSNNIENWTYNWQRKRKKHITMKDCQLWLCDMWHGIVDCNSARVSGLTYSSTTAIEMLNVTRCRGWQRVTIYNRKKYCWVTERTAGLNDECVKRWRLLFCYWDWDLTGVIAGRWTWKDGCRGVDRWQVRSLTQSISDSRRENSLMH